VQKYFRQHHLPVSATVEYNCSMTFEYKMPDYSLTNMCNMFCQFLAEHIVYTSEKLAPILSIQWCLYTTWNNIYNYITKVYIFELLFCWVEYFFEIFPIRARYYCSIIVTPLNTLNCYSPQGCLYKFIQAQPFVQYFLQLYKLSFCLFTANRVNREQTQQFFVCID
jgi:hypothetical protein